MRCVSYWRKSIRQGSTRRNPCRLSRHTKGVAMQKADLPFLSASALGTLLQTREVSPVEATEAYLERIEAVDGALHSYITVCRDSALQAARTAEQAIRGGQYLGPLHGVPFAVKDQFWTAGILTTCGSKLL